MNSVLNSGSSVQSKLGFARTLRLRNQYFSFFYWTHIRHLVHRSMQHVWDSQEKVLILRLVAAFSHKVRLDYSEEMVTEFTDARTFCVDVQFICGSCRISRCHCKFAEIRSLMHFDYHSWVLWLCDAVMVCNFWIIVQIRLRSTRPAGRPTLCQCEECCAVIDRLHLCLKSGQIRAAAYRLS